MEGAAASGGGCVSKLDICPLTLAEANAFVEQ